MRLRPGFFPFVEPGFELDVRCPFCEEGCSVCKQPSAFSADSTCTSVGGGTFITGTCQA